MQMAFFCFSCESFVTILPRRSRLLRTTSGPTRLIRPRLIDCNRRSEQTVKIVPVRVEGTTTIQNPKYTIQIQIRKIHNTQKRPSGLCRYTPARGALGGLDSRISLEQCLCCRCQTTILNASYTHGYVCFLH